MRKRKWLALALAVILVVGLMGGVVSARSSSPAAPAVANRLLKDAGIRGAGQIMRHVAQAMGRGAVFPDNGDFVEKSDTEAYWDAVARFLDSLGIDVDSTQRPVRHERPERPFSPKDIDDLYLWLDAGKGITKDADANVTRWADQSGNGNHALASGNDRPKLVPDGFEGDHPVVWFNGTQVMYTNIQPDEDDFEDGVTVFLVANFFEAGYALGSWNEPYFYMGIWEDNDEDYWIDTGFGDSWSFSEDLVDLQRWRILEMINDGEDTVVYDDGEVVSTYPSSFTGTTEYELAIGNANGTDYYFNGDIAEILIYNRALDDEEREEIEDYLKDKYFD